MNVEKFLPEEFKQDEKDYWQGRVKLLSKYEAEPLHKMWQVLRPEYLT